MIKLFLSLFADNKYKNLGYLDRNTDSKTLVSILQFDIIYMSIRVGVNTPSNTR